MLVDRGAERDTVGRLLTAVRDGLSGVLVMRGQPGIGKTALLDWAAEAAADMQVARVAAVESEMDLGFAGLHQLLVPFLGGLGRLPDPQREALSSVFGLAAGPPPDRFLVGLATLTLITEAAAERPVLCVIDDAQWMDRVSVEVLGFVARRLFADRVGMLFTLREGEEQRAAVLDGLPDVIVGSLPEDAADELLTITVGQAADQRVRGRVLAETAGNPLALVEFALELTPEELSGLVPLAAPLRFGGRVDELYRSRVRALPGEARLLLLVAAADQTGDPDRIWRAAARLEIGAEAAELPAVGRLMTWAPRVLFRHPLARSAAYYTAPPTARRRAHEALAAVSDPGRDPDRRAWHLAEAAAGPDEQVAAELERSADRARGRGGWVSGAVFLERAAELTPEVAARARRLLEAADARFVAGDPTAVRALLDRAVPGLGDPLARGRARRLEGLSRYAAGELSKAIAALLEAARLLEPHDPKLARDARLDAILLAVVGSGADDKLTEVLGEIRSAPAAEGAQPTVADLLLHGYAAWCEHRYDECVALFREAIKPLTGDKPVPDDVMPHALGMLMAAGCLYDDTVLHEVELRFVPELRRRGALGVLLPVLFNVAHAQLIEGRFTDVEVTVAEGRALGEATGFRSYLAMFACTQLWVLTWRGQEAEARALADQLLAEFAGREQGLESVYVRRALTWLELGLGNYREALRNVAEVTRADDLGVVELIEAAVRCGEQETAAAALAGFTPVAQATRTPLATGLDALCHAMVAADDEAEGHYQLAVERLRHSRLVPFLARAHLLYGEWLRRQRRRRDAREQLHAAWELFDGLGMAAFAERARAELRATGEQARKRDENPRESLTPQESQIARLAADGASNPDIAARLFISSSTVDYHLRKVFRKLGITSRVRLPYALGDTGEAPAERLPG